MRQPPICTPCLRLIEVPFRQNEGAASSVSMKKLPTGASQMPYTDCVAVQLSAAPVQMSASTIVAHKAHNVTNLIYRLTCWKSAKLVKLQGIGSTALPIWLLHTLEDNITTQDAKQSAVPLACFLSS